MLPIYKTGGKTGCNNYSEIHSYVLHRKVTLLLLAKLCGYVDEITGDHQSGFQRNRQTTDYCALNRYQRINFNTRGVAC